MNVRARMQALLGEDIREAEYFETSSKGKGDAELVCLKATISQHTIEFFFADSASAKTAAALLKDIGYSIKTSTSSYFTSAAVLKASDWYKEQVTQRELAARFGSLSQRAKKYNGKSFKLSKTPYPGYRAGVYSFKTDMTRSYTLYAEVKFAENASGGTAAMKVKELDIRYYESEPDALDALEQILDLLDTGTVVDKWKSQADYAIVTHAAWVKN